jgi:imidazole glycerol-phosphate synthase subunit HisH
MTIAIVNYGAGNLASVKKAFDVLGEHAVITADAELVASAEKIVVPGVGHFAATEALEANGLRPVLQEAIMRGKPVLGICLGMQWLFESSTEAPQVKGLGILHGACAQFPAAVKSPHVGWNEIKQIRRSRLLDDITEKLFVYFTHSFRAPIVEQTVASCDYGDAFTAVVEQERIFGVQFHPEKSGSVGRKLLQNFCELPC